MRRHRRAFMSYLPDGIKVNGGWTFVGIICMLSGVSFATGIAESTSITRVLDPIGLQVWGGVLGVAGFLLCVAVIWSLLALQKLALHFLSICLLTYGSWILTVVPAGKTGITIILIVVLVVLAQIRCYMLRQLLNPKPKVFPPIEEGE